jgi:hypothetical protein
MTRRPHLAALLSVSAVVALAGCGDGDTPEGTVACAAPTAESVKADVEKAPFVGRGVVIAHTRLTKGDKRDQGLTIRLSKAVKGESPGEELAVWPTPAIPDLDPVTVGEEVVIFAAPFADASAAPSKNTEGKDVVAYSLNGMIAISDGKVARVCAGERSVRTDPKVIEGL